MAKTTIDTWQTTFHRLSGLFEPIVPAFHAMDHREHHWPGLQEYQTLLNSHTPPITNARKIPIKFVPQAATCKSFQEQYEPRIYLTGEVQTRLNNWHDLFQVLVWKTFPKTKRLLNALHYQAASQRLAEDNKNTQRTEQENFLTLFDECGIVIISCEQYLLNLIRAFQWPELFWENRNKFQSKIACYTFGHAMYEKALTPYIGMTANAILILTDDAFFKLDNLKKRLAIDDMIVSNLRQERSLNPRQKLNPFPILGVPQWYNENKSLDFYLNKNYFREGRR